MNKQFYIDRAEACLDGIEKIEAVINKAESDDKKGELICKFMNDLNILVKTYYLARAEYDKEFKKLLEEKSRGTTKC